MPKNRHRAILQKTLLSIAALFVFIGMIALGFSQTLSAENRALIVIITSVGVILCFLGMVSTRSFWK